MKPLKNDNHPSTQVEQPPSPHAPCLAPRPPCRGPRSLPPLPDQVPVPAADSLQGLGADDAVDACTPVSNNSSTITTPYEECTDGTRVVLESEYEPDQEVVEGLTANGGIEVDAEGSLTPYLRPASPGGDERRRVAEEEAALMADAAPSASVPQEVANIEARIASDDDVEAEVEEAAEEEVEIEVAEAEEEAATEVEVEVDTEVEVEVEVQPQPSSEEQTAMLAEARAEARAEAAAEAISAEKALESAHAATKDELDALKKREEAMLHTVSTQLVPGVGRTRESCAELKAATQEALSGCAKDVGSLMAKLLAGVKDHAEIFDQTSTALKRETARRKRVFNELQQIRGNIRVFVRIRPAKKDTVTGVSVTNSGDVLVSAPKASGKAAAPSKAANGSNGSSAGGSKLFEFDHVFPQNSTQDQVFSEVCPLVTSVMDGYHASIIAYGQTGSGKTFTMEGTNDMPGVNIRALNELFGIKEEKERSGLEKVTVKLLMVEIYNEVVRDLLVEPSTGKPKAGAKKSESVLDIRQNEGGVYLPGATTICVSSAEDVARAMQTGKANRATSATRANSESSRSHSVLMIDVSVENVQTGVSTNGRLSLVDLAGSERIRKTGASGSTLKEAQNINKSLSALGNVISALRAKQEASKPGSAHVPFRDSKLTYLLQDSLGADNKTLMFVQVSPEEEHIQESLCSITFGQRARNVELGVSGSKSKGARGSSQQEIQKIKEKLAEAEDETRRHQNAAVEAEARLEDAAASHDQVNE